MKTCEWKRKAAKHGEIHPTFFGVLIWPKCGNFLEYFGIFFSCVYYILDAVSV